MQSLGFSLNIYISVSEANDSGRGLRILIVTISPENLVQVWKVFLHLGMHVLLVGKVHAAVEIQPVEEEFLGHASLPRIVPVLRGIVLEHLHVLDATEGGWGQACCRPVMHFLMSSFQVAVQNAACYG